MKSLIVSIVSAAAAYLHPIYGEVHTILTVLAVNFFVGLLVGLFVNNEGFQFRKAWRCVVEATAFFALVCFIYYTGDHKGTPESATQCVSFVTYAVMYFYTTNILRNMCTLLPDGTVGHRCASFLYFVVSVEFIKKIPFLADYFNQEKEKEVKDEIK